MRHRLALFTALALVGCGSSPDRCAEERWQTLLLDHYLRYPSMELDDALKLVQQATVGAEHAALDTAAADRRLREELLTMGAGPMDQVVDTLGPDGAFARVNLRPWRSRGGDPGELARAFAATIASPGDSTHLECALGVLRRLAAEFRVPWSVDDVEGRIAEWTTAGRPAMHHSERYRANYLPAYRVVAVERIAQLMRTLPEPPD
jgi:hypothetical protein